MRLYLECNMGASGDMLMAALYELLPDKKAFRDRMERLGLPGVTLEYEPSVKCGIKGTHVSVKVSGDEEKSEDVHVHTRDAGTEQTHTHSDNGRAPHTHSHAVAEQTHKHTHDSGELHSHSHGSGEQHTHTHDNEVIPHTHNSETPRTHTHDGESPHTHTHSAKRYDYKEIQDIIKSLGLSDNILEDALGVYKILAEAEAAVHGVTLNKLHLHEVGALDAVADVVGCCLLVNMLGVTDITASPVHVGSGSVKCEHGILPVPAPAAAEILKGVPIYGGSIQGELCTPTGAAILKRFVKSFGQMQPMIVRRIGCGMGKKDFPAANCLRAFLCEDETSAGGSRDAAYEISCNLDDMTPEAIGAAFEVLLDNGALDVYTTPILMKKNRSAVMLSCLCAEDKREKLSQLILEHTTTLGVRVAEYRRSILDRTIETISTEFGSIRIKRAHGFGIIKDKPEYEDVLTAAKHHKIPFTTVHNAAMKARKKNTTSNK